LIAARRAPRFVSTPRTQARQARRLLALVRSHPLQNAIENADRFADVRALVQHDALGADPHRGVRDLGA